MPSKKQRTKALKEKNLIQYEGEIYVSSKGISRTLLKFGMAEALNTGGAWNGHCWCEREDGAMYDPTPLSSEYPELPKLNGTIERYYKKYPSYVKDAILQNKEEFRNECIEEAAMFNYKWFPDEYETAEEYEADLIVNPKEFMCWQNCRAYCNANPEWTLCVGAFGFRLDNIPHNSTPGLKKELKKYKSQKTLNFISLDYGF